MDALLEKISSYNVINFILPGVAFAWLLNFLFKIDLLSFFNGEIIVNLFLFYFLGMTISRLGSLFIPSILKKIKVVTYASHADFISAEKIDPKISTLSEVNSIYRTFIALFMVLLIISFAFPILGREIPQLDVKIFFSAFFCFIFILSYRKQTKFIVSRVQTALKSNI